MRIECPHCRSPIGVALRDAGTTYRCGGCGKSFVVPADVAQKGQPHQLSVFPVAALVLLHYVTAGVFSVIYLNLLHDKMPRLRRSDPSATKAIGLAFVPGVNLVWFFFTYRRLCVRINEQRCFHGLPETAPTSLAIAVALLTLFGSLTYVFPAPGLVVLSVLGLVVMPVFAALVQHSINELVDRPAVPALGG
jgi:predicted Zn finger-like uncharacterized protein